jgi:hypothetical protein
MAFSGDASILLGDDLLVDPLADTGLFDLGSTSVSMLGTMDDDGNGFNFALGAGLGALFIGGVDLILQQDLLVNELMLDAIGQIDINGYNLTVVARYQGSMDQIIDSVGSGRVNLPAVPSPTPLSLLAAGVAGLLLRRRDRRAKILRRGDS